MGVAHPGARLPESWAVGDHAPQAALLGQPAQSRRMAHRARQGLRRNPATKRARGRPRRDRFPFLGVGHADHPEHVGRHDEEDLTHTGEPKKRRRGGRGCLRGELAQNDHAPKRQGALQAEHTKEKNPFGEKGKDK